MPIYEYICANCRKKVSLFNRRYQESASPDCPQCGKPSLTRIFSSFAVHKSISTIHEESGEPGSRPGPDYYKDPRNIGRHLEKKFSEMNIEMPSEIQNSIKAAREGALPDSLKDLESGSADSAYH